MSLGNLTLDELKQILGVALKGNDFAEIYYERNVSNSISLEHQKIVSLDNGVDVGVGIRIIKDYKTEYEYTNDITFDNLMNLTKKLNMKNKDLADINIIKDYKLETPSKFYTKNFNDIDIEEKIKLLKEGDILARNLTKEQIVQVSASYGDAFKEIIIINSDGKYVKEELNLGVLRYTVILKKGDLVQTGYESKGTKRGFEFFETGIHKDMVKEAVRQAETMLRADLPISGKMDIIMAGRAGGTMVHEACGHGLELDLVQDGISIYRDKLGRKIGNDKVTVIDSGVIEGYFGSSYFDSEANKTEESILIENGIVKKFMNDYITAKRGGFNFTGNGRRASYKHIPIPRMRNTYIKPGSDKLEDMLKDINKGIYVCKMGGGQVDTVTGDFVFAASESYLIEQGIIKQPLRGLTLMGTGKDILQKIVGVGEDLSFTVGMCGKGGQNVPVTTGQPTIKMKDIIVGGVK